MLPDLPEYDARITDGTNQVDVQAVNGDPSAIRRMPRGQGVEPKEISQSSWVGGRGANVLAADPDKFDDSYNGWSHTAGMFTAGPLMRWGKRKQTTNPAVVAYWPGDGVYQQYAYNQMVLTPGIKYAIKSNGNTEGTPRMVFLASGDVTNITVAFHADSAGAPGALAASGSAKTYGDTATFSYCYAEVNSLLASTQWIVFTISAGQAVLLAGDTDVSTSSLRYNGSAWVADKPVYYTAVSEYHGFSHNYNFFRNKFFMFREAVYCTWSIYLYLNGDRGLCTSTGGTTVVCASPNAWTTNLFRGCVFKVVGGSSAIITSNDTAGNLTLDRSVPEVGLQVEYVILGSDRFVHIGTLNAEATSISPCNNGVYIAQGEAQNILKFRQYNNAGTWTTTLTADGTNKAHHVRAAVRSGKVKLYRITDERRKFSSADVPDDIFSAALTFGTSGPVTVDGSRVQAVLDYDGAIWCTTESDVYSIQDTGAGDLSVKRPGPSDQPVLDETNGIGATWWNTNLYFGYMDGYMRLYGRTVDDVGPNKEDGLPLDRRGNVVSAAPIFGFMACAISSLQNQGWVSSVMATPAPGGAWHELLRGLTVNYPIDSLFYQNIPLISNRLWFSHGENPCYLFLPNSAQNPLQDTPSTATSPYPGMVYGPAAVLKTSWIDFDAPEREHDWTELRVYNENVGAAPYGTIKPRITIWPASTSDLTEVTELPYQYQYLDIRGNRARLTFILEQRDARIPAVLRSFLLRAIQMNEVRYDVVVDFEHSDNLQLNNYGGQAIDPEEQTLAALAILDSWQEKSTRLTLYTRHPAVNGIRGHIEPVPFTCLEWDAESKKLTGQIMFRQA